MDAVTFDRKIAVSTEACAPQFQPADKIFESVFGKKISTETNK